MYIRRFINLINFMVVYFLSSFVFSNPASKISTPPYEVERIALVLGVNNGGTNRIVLRYAHSDAMSFAAVLKELGRVSEKNLNLIIGVTKEELIKRFDTIKRDIQESYRGKKIEFLFYYSGHSDRDGLLLGNSKFLYTHLLEKLAEINSTIRVVIIDSCFSGVLTQFKGGTPAAPIFFMDKANDLKGYAYLASSSADEVSQESPSVNGSFYTHYFVSGLRGAADFSLDDQVSLDEAYQYAYNKTLSRTANTTGVPQHPRYKINFSGKGNFVLTDLRKAKTAVTFMEGVEGKLFIRNQNHLAISELNKQKGKQLKLGLKPGKYKVKLYREEKIFESSFSINQNDFPNIKMSHFKLSKLKNAKNRKIYFENQLAGGSIFLSGAQFVFAKNQLSLSALIGVGYSQKAVFNWVGKLNYRPTIFSWKWKKTQLSFYTGILSHHSKFENSIANALGANAGFIADFGKYFKLYFENHFLWDLRTKNFSYRPAIGFVF